MKIGILSKRTTMLAGRLKRYLENEGHEVKIYTSENLCINEVLFRNDFYILKSKSIFFLYAGFYLKENNIPVVPNPDITYKHKNRIEAHFLIKEADLFYPNYFFGSIDALKSQLDDSNFPLVLKPLMGSGSRGVKIVNSFEDLSSINRDVLYLENFIKGTHYLVYFIDDETCTLEKPPLNNEHIEMTLIPTPKDVKEIINKWKSTHDLLFGHLDIIREDSSNKLIVVDPGSFPEFSNWKRETDPVSKTCNLILEKVKKLKA